MNPTNKLTCQEETSQRVSIYHLWNLYRHI